MASGGLAGAQAVGLVSFASVPVLGWVAGIAAAYIDAAYIYPAIAGKGRSAARSPRFLDVPVGSNEAGAPRIWALGARVRVPTHVLWQAEKVRESMSATQKGGTAVPIRRVYIDALLAVNDRPTRRLRQLVGNGKLILYRSRNLIEVTTDQMSASYDSGPANVLLQMSSTADPDFADKFKAGDVVRPAGFTYVAGPTNFNGTLWNVVSVAAHASGAPSSMRLTPLDGQTMTSLNYTGGNVFAPAQIERVDDALAHDVQTSTSLISSSNGSPTQPATQLRIDFENSMRNPSDVFQVGDLVRVRDCDVYNTLSVMVGSVPTGTIFRVTLISDVSKFVALDVQTAEPGSGNGGVCNPAVGGSVFGFGLRSTSATDVVKIEFANPPLFTAGLFPSTFEPDLHFYNGSETQGEASLLVAAKGTGNIPAYRGVAYQGLDQFFATQFGDSLPFALEALIDVDASMSWGEAFKQVLLRAGIPEGAIDISGVMNRPFPGMFLRGAVPTLTAMQPMLVAGQVIGQTRDGVISLFHVDNADVVQIENGSEFSDFLTNSEGDARADDKVSVEDEAQEDLPTSIGVRHQDPDNQYADGYQHFGLRNPDGVDHQNEQELDLSNIALSRKEARNLAATTIRRAWINRRRYRFTLPAAYLHVLENDLLTFTTDSGQDVTCRVIQRDIGADFRVAVTAVDEDVELDVVGSPVQTGSGNVPPAVVVPALLRVVPYDAPGVRNEEVVAPGVKLAICAENGGQNWAGAAIWESVNGATYQLVGHIGAQAAVGTLDADLTAQTASESYGTTTVSVRSQTVDVTFAYEGDTAIEAATSAEAQAGKNWCLILGDTNVVEVAAFTTVTPNGDRNYTLGGWFRGLRGTPSDAKVAGSQIVLLWPAANNVWFREFPGAIQPTTLDYKVVPFGLSLDDVAAVSLSTSYGTNWWNARPLPVRSISKLIGSSPFDATITVDAHWTRQVLPLGTQPPHPLDEPFEAYRFDIYDPTGATLQRSITLTAEGSGSNTLRDRYITYTAAQQTADGYTPSGSTVFWVDVVQLGEFGEGPSIKKQL